LQLKKDKNLTKDETEILLLAINKAINHGPLLDKYDDIDQRILKAQKILRGGRTKPNLIAALDLIMEREKGTKHAKRDWHEIADDYVVLTEDHEPCEAN
jgi:predicted O-linked N-acetylglucosamine transferase (SPINDLY family)